MSHGEAVSRFCGFLEGDMRLAHLGFDLSIQEIENEDWQFIEDQVIAIGAGEGMEP